MLDAQAYGGGRARQGRIDGRCPVLDSAAQSSWSSSPRRRATPAPASCRAEAHGRSSQHPGTVPREAGKDSSRSLRRRLLCSVGATVSAT